MNVEPGLILKSFFRMILKDESVVATKAIIVQASIVRVGETPDTHSWMIENSADAFEALYVSK